MRWHSFDELSIDKPQGVIPLSSVHIFVFDAFFLFLNTSYQFTFLSGFNFAFLTKQKTFFALFFYASIYLMLFYSLQLFLFPVFMIFLSRIEAHNDQPGIYDILIDDVFNRMQISLGGQILYASFSTVLSELIVIDAECGVLATGCPLYCRQSCKF